MGQNFNPRSLTGAIQCLQRAFCSSRHFNPRSLTGAILFWRPSCRCWIFQSTLPYGSDSMASGATSPQPIISIHAPLRERYMGATPQMQQRLFQSTLPYGSDDYLRPHLRLHIHFNPRSLTGAMSKRILKALYSIFQSTLPYGSDT